MSELLARGYITLAVVSDGYSIILTAPSISIPAKSDGSDPDLTNAHTEISLWRGNEQLDFEITDIIPSTNGITHLSQKTPEGIYQVSITGFPSNIQTGYLEIKLKAVDGYVANTRFVFSVIKHATGLEWIEDWNGTYTQIGDNYVITPRLFAGHKTPDGKITGVYLGKLKGYIGQTLPYTFEQAEEGIYGYVDNKIVFYINNLAARIAGWQITPESIQCLDGTLTIKSEGSISSQNNNVVNWRLNKDGSAMFANGKVTMDANGNASFDGKIVARDGEISGWTIGKEAIYKVGLSLNATKRFVAVSNVSSVKPTGNQLDWVKAYGGAAMYHVSDADYGFIGYKGNSLTFSAGSRNYIAGWEFDGSAIWLGTKNNNMGQYAGANSIVIGSNGIRGNKFYFDKDGKGSVAGGNITWDAKGNVVFSNSVVINWANISGALGNKLTKIDANGIYTGTLKAEQVNALTCTFDKGTIGGWTINKDNISKNNVVLSSDGSIANGTKWRLNNDGSGFLAGGNITWDTSGNFTAKNGVFTGEIHSFSGMIGGFKIGQYSLENLENEACIKISRRNIVVGPGGLIEGGTGSTTKPNGAYNLYAAIGNSLPYSYGISVAAMFQSVEKGQWNTNMAMIVDATGSTYQYKIGGGNANIAMKITGGVDWSITPDDHWSMPGLLKILHIRTDANPTTIQILKEWGHGIRIKTAALEQAVVGAGNGQWIRINYFANTRNIFAIATNRATAWGNENLWDLHPVIESSCDIADEATNEKRATITFWHGGRKYMPHEFVVYFFGEPS